MNNYSRIAIWLTILLMFPIIGTFVDWRSALSVEVIFITIILSLGAFRKYDGFYYFIPETVKKVKLRCTKCDSVGSEIPCKKCGGAIGEVISGKKID